jgi:pectin methylesterase-like acyl-CoA thioesterase
MKQKNTRGLFLCMVMCAVFYAIPLMHIPIFAQPLSGEYTIGTGGDFATISDAIDVLNNEGRTGPITFSIFAGTYEEQFTITSHTGMSEENPVVFKTHSGNPGDVKIAYTAESNGDNYIVRIQSASYITFRDLAFVAMGSTHGTIVRMEGASHSNISLLENSFQGLPDANSQQQYAIVHATAGLADNTVISGNTFEAGGNSIYMKQASHGARTVISDNVSSGAAGDAFYLERQTAPLVSGNVITHSGLFYAIHLRECNYNLEVLGNKIDISGESRVGIYLNASEGHPFIEEQVGLIANNFITVRGSASGRDGIRLTNSKVQKIYHNSIYVINPNPNSQGLHLSGTGNEEISIFNNSFSNTGHSFQSHFPGGYAIRIDDPPAVLEMDYNNIFSTGNYIARWGDMNITDLPMLKVQGNEGRNINSISVFPHYISDIDLHTVSPYLDGAGIPLERVTDDIDGEPRDGSAPDIGADEFTPDPSTTTPLAGTFTIGATGDYSSFQEAADDLLLKGLSSPTIFDVFPGMYNENFTLFEIPSEEETNGLTKTITFRSQTGNPEDVTLFYEAESDNDNYVVNLRSAKNITFENLKIVSNTSSTASHGRIFVIQGYSKNLKFLNNILVGTPVNNSSSPANAIFHSEPSLTDNTVISGNIMTGGSYGIYMIGGFNINPTRTAITGNSISLTPGGYMAIRLHRQIAPVISNNETTPGAYGMYLQDCGGAVRVTKNKIDVNGLDHGIQLFRCTGGADPEERILIANNFVTHRGGNNSAVGGIIIGGNSQNLDVFYNSVNIISAHPVTSALWIGSTIDVDANINVQNNIFVNTGGGYAYRVTHPTAVDLSDYNDIFTSGEQFAHWGGDDVADLAGLQNASGKDLNSISADPLFVSVNNLHARAAAVDSAGMPLTSVVDDIDGEPRDLNFPDIGADEFVFGFNYPPTIVSVPDTVAYVDSLYQYQVIAEDIDSDTITYSFTTAPEFLSIDPVTGLISGTPGPGDVGEHIVVVLVDDGSGNQVKQEFTIVVEIATGITDKTGQLPDRFALYQNYPNPFNPSTTIRYDIPVATEVRIEVYNVLGQWLALLVSEHKTAGSYAINYDASRLPSGSYLYRFQAGSYTAVRKFVVIK